MSALCQMLTSFSRVDDSEPRQLLLSGRGSVIPGPAG